MVYIVRFDKIAAYLGCNSKKIMYFFADIEKCVNFAANYAMFLLWIGVFNVYLEIYY